MKVITLREPATCADCGRELPAGTEARYYSRDRIYCNPPCGGKAPAAAPGGQGAPPIGARDALLVFLKRVDVALQELINNLTKK